MLKLGLGGKIGERLELAGGALLLRARPRLSQAVLVLTEECDSKCRSCSFRIAAPGELGVDGMKRVVDELAELGTQTVTVSGGEPLTVAGLPELGRHIGRRGMSATLLTNGLKLAERHAELESVFDEIIVSLDGWDAESYAKLRGVDGFLAIGRGIAAMRGGLSARRPRFTARTTLQHGNAGHVEALAKAASTLGFDAISFLAVDPGSQRFGRTRERMALLPTAEEIEVLRRGIEALAMAPLARGFIVEPAAKLRAIADHLEAARGHGDYPQKQCNAPLVSVVVGPRGDVRPCFFKPPLGSVRDGSLRDVLTSREMFNVRATLDVANDADCRPCVCPLRRSLSEVVG